MRKYFGSSKLLLVWWSTFLLLALAAARWSGFSEPGQAQPLQHLTIDPTPSAATTPAGVTESVTTTVVNSLQNPAISPTVHYGVDLDPSAAASKASATEWRDICVTHRLEITGIGMGDDTHMTNPQTLLLNDAGSVNWLLAQVAGLDAEPDSLSFSSDTAAAITMHSPTAIGPYGYTFEAQLQPSSSITALMTGPQGISPRGLVLYAKRATASPWTSIGRTTNAFVLAGSMTNVHTETLTLPPLTKAEDLFVSAVVIDNDEDWRLMKVTAAAGGVTEAVIEAGPTDGPLLNITHLRLNQVPAGTNQVSITLESPLPHGNGDSLILAGLNVSYSCTGNKFGSIFLPVIHREPTICRPYDFEESPGGWLVDSDAKVRTGYTQNDEAYFIERHKAGIRIVQAPTLSSNQYIVEVDAGWQDLGYEYGLIAGQTNDANSLTYRLGIDPVDQRYRVRYGSDEAGWGCADQSSDDPGCWLKPTTPALFNPSQLSNHLKAECNSSTLDFHVNGTHVWRGLFVPCRGRVGVFAQSSTQDPDAYVLFDNFELTCQSQSGSFQALASSAFTNPTSHAEGSFDE